MNTILFDTAIVSFRRTKLLFSKLNTLRPTKDVLTPWKWPQDLQKDIFVHLPVTLGVGFGIAAGAWNGYEFSRDEIYSINFIYTTLGMMYGGFVGRFMGLLWPVSLPLFFLRAYYPTAPQNKKE